MELMLIVVLIVALLLISLLNSQIIYFLVGILAVWLYKLNNSIESLKIETARLKSQISQLLNPNQDSNARDTEKITEPDIFDLYPPKCS